MSNVSYNRKRRAWAIRNMKHFRNRWNRYREISIRPKHGPTLTHSCDFLPTGRRLWRVFSGPNLNTMAMATLGVIFEITSSSSLRDIATNHFVTTAAEADIGGSIKRKQFRVSLKKGCRKETCWPTDCLLGSSYITWVCEISMRSSYMLRYWMLNYFKAKRESVFA